jgi:hypothetical protein
MVCFLRVWDFFGEMMVRLDIKVGGLHRISLLLEMGEWGKM